LIFNFLNYKRFLNGLYLSYNNDVIKIRLAKCKKKRGFPKSERFQWQEVDVDHIDDFSQVNHINFKNPEEFTACYEKVLEEFEDIKNF